MLGIDSCLSRSFIYIFVSRRIIIVSEQEIIIVRSDSRQSLNLCKEDCTRLRAAFNWLKNAQVLLYFISAKKLFLLEFFFFVLCLLIGQFV